MRANPAMVLAVTVAGGLAAAGFALGGVPGILAGAAVLLVATAVGRRYGNRMLMSWLEARPAPSTLPVGLVKARLAELSRRAGVAMPEIRVVESDQINVFALDAGGVPVVCVTDGFLRYLTPTQEEALLALQVARIRSGAARETAWGALAGGVVSWVAGLGFHARADLDSNPVALPSSTLTAPLAAAAVRWTDAARRNRDAHEKAAELLDDAAPLLRALERAEYTSYVRPLAVPAALRATGVVSPHLGAAALSLSRLYGSGVPVAHRRPWLAPPSGEPARALTPPAGLPEAA